MEGGGGGVKGEGEMVEDMRIVNRGGREDEGHCDKEKEEREGNGMGWE